MRRRKRMAPRRGQTHRLKPLPTWGEMLVSLKVSSSAFWLPLWFAAGACHRHRHQDWDLSD